MGSLKGVSRGSVASGEREVGSAQCRIEAMSRIYLDTQILKECLWRTITDE